MKQNKNQAPFLLALGSISDLKFREFYIVIHKIAVPCGDKFLQALDAITKVYTVFSLPLPIESFSPWKFILHGVLGKPNPVALSPVVQALIGQIMQNI